MWKHDVTDGMKDELDKEGTYDRDIVVEEDVWLGINVTLLNGARIGRGCIVGAGCVVSGIIPPYSVIAGNPWRIVRFVFSPEEIIEHEAKLYTEDERIPLDVLQRNFQKWMEGHR